MNASGGMPGMSGLPPGMEGMMGGMPGMAGMGGGGGGGGRGRPQQPEKPSILPNGTRVFVRGLQGAAQHNGKAGEVESYDQSSSRYFVQLSGEGDVIKIKFDNLLQNCRCEVTGMVNRAELNGKSATLVGYDEEKGRIHADIQGVGRASLQKENLILSAGCRGKVFGLTSESGSKWNEQVGKVVSFDREAGRYVLEMTATEQLRIKPGNLAF